MGRQLDPSRTKPIVQSTLIFLRYISICPPITETIIKQYIRIEFIAGKDVKVLERPVSKINLSHRYHTIMVLLNILFLF